MNLTIHFCRVVITAAAMLFCLCGIGCKQMSHGVRSDQFSEGELIPPSPELQPVPQSATPLHVPPPAPPSDAARLDADEDFWDQEREDIADLDDEDEFFADETPTAPPALSRQRGTDFASRLADNARSAAARREWERKHQLPIIVPATPTLMRVSAEEPGLLPVPK